MVCLIILIIFYLVAIFGPILAGMVGLDPYKFDPGAISDLGGKPTCPTAASAPNTPWAWSGGQAVTSSPSCCTGSGSRS